MQDLLNVIEDARRSGKVNNDAARAASIALGLTGDGAMLACRLLAQGSDPASLELVAAGAVSAPIAMAHRQGPGGLTGADRDRWLLLAAASHDEATESSLLDRVRGFVRGLREVEEAERDAGKARAMIEREEQRIKASPYRMATVSGREVRLYESDLGFAAAYWSGEPCAAVLGVYGGKPYVAVGSNGVTLAGLGIEVEKLLAPAFGIVESPAAVEAIKASARPLT